MELKYIRQKCCPICSSQVVREYASPNFHTNGEREESRLFSCGHEIVYSPNFKKCRTEKPCPKDKTVLDRKRKKEEAGRKLYKYMKKMDLHEEDKNKMLRDARLYLDVIMIISDEFKKPEGAIL